MRKPEMKFLTDLKKSFKRQGVWFYKIPDTPPTARFTPAKPFDAVLCVEGGLVAIEGKWLDWTNEKGKRSFGYNDLRDSQKLGLQHIEDHNGQSWVALGLRAKRGDVRALFWEHRIFKKLCQSFDGNIPRDVLEETPFIPLHKDKLYDLTQLMEEIRANIFFQNLIA